MYYPGLSCSGDPTGNRRIVTKIQLLDRTARNEVAIGRRIQRFQKFRLFFLPVLKSCPFKMQEAKNKIEPCDVISDLSAKYVAMDIPYINEIHFTKTLTRMSTQRRILTLIDTYKYLLYALSELHDLDIVHYDLKFGNVLFRQLTLEPRVSDFGISIYNVARLQSTRFPLAKGSRVTLSAGSNKDKDRPNRTPAVVMKVNRDKTYNLLLENGEKRNRVGRSKIDAVVPTSALKELFYHFSVEYSAWCIDIVILSYLAESDGPLGVGLDEESASEIGSLFIEKSPLYKLLKPGMVKAAQEALRQQLSKYAEMDRTSLIDFLVSQNGTWDNYALSMMYLEQNPRMFRYDEATCSLLGEWNTLLEQNVSANPVDRHTPAETLSLFDDIFLCSTAFADSAREESKTN